MRPLTWKPELSVGHAEIDEQHRWLVETVNRLHHSLGEGGDKASTIATINGLLDYAASHFRTEEEIFRRTKFPYAAEHIREHESFTTQVIAFRTRYVTVRENIGPELVNFLSEWLVTHLREADSRYVPCLARKQG